MPNLDVKTSLLQLRQKLPCVPPIPERALKSLHAAQDYDGMVRLIKNMMNVEVRLVVEWVNSGGPEEMKDAPAWIRMPVEMPFYGTKAFKVSFGVPFGCRSGVPIGCWNASVLARARTPSLTPSVRAGDLCGPPDEPMLDPAVASVDWATAAA
jgi:hypothetical protein